MRGTGNSTGLYFDEYAKQEQDDACEIIGSVFLNLHHNDVLNYSILDLALCGNSQNFLHKFVRFFVTLGLKILRLLRQKVVFEAYVMKF